MRTENNSNEPREPQGLRLPTQAASRQHRRRWLASVITASMVVGSAATATPGSSDEAVQPVAAVVDNPFVESSGGETILRIGATVTLANSGQVQPAGGTQSPIESVSNAVGGARLQPIGRAIGLRSPTDASTQSPGSQIAIEFDSPENPVRNNPLTADAGTPNQQTSRRDPSTEKFPAAEGRKHQFSANPFSRNNDSRTSPTSLGEAMAVTNLPEIDASQFDPDMTSAAEPTGGQKDSQGTIEFSFNDQTLDSSAGLASEKESPLPARDVASRNNQSSIAFEAAAISVDDDQLTTANENPDETSDESSQGFSFHLTPDDQDVWSIGDDGSTAPSNGHPQDANVSTDSDALESPVVAAVEPFEISGQVAQLIVPEPSDLVHTDREPAGQDRVGREQTDDLAASQSKVNFQDILHQYRYRPAVEVDAVSASRRPAPGAESKGSVIAVPDDYLATLANPPSRSDSATDAPSDSETTPVQADASDESLATQSSPTRLILPPGMKMVPLQVDFASVRSLTIGGRLRDLQVMDGSVCQAVATGPNQIKLIGTGNGVTQMVVMANCEGTDRVRAFEITVDDHERAGEADDSIESLKRSIAQTFPDCRIELEHRGDALRANGVCCDERQAKQILRMIRRTCLMPVEDRLSIR